jgi:para-nitrobenzyl esterase
MRRLILLGAVVVVSACNPVPNDVDGGSGGSGGGDASAGGTASAGGMATAGGLATAGGAAGGSPDGGGGEPCGVGVVPTPGVVVTTTGAVSGTLRDDVYEWLGIPYATPPTGALRWKAPAPASCWAGVRPATTAGQVCPQLQPDGGVRGAEDCLFVNVVAKRGLTNAPVMVWIHGGGNTTGSGSDDLFAGHDLSNRRDVVVVTFNYRLGALGNLVHAGLSAESDAGVSGNYGILDQHALLRWVRDNIRGFGGDPSKVLLFGESAGGQNTLLNLFTPGSRGLFHAAIAQSGGVYGTTLTQALTGLTPLVQGMNCHTATDPVACLRAVPATTLAAFPSAIGPLDRGGVRYGPVIDGVVVPGNGFDLAAQGRQHGVPVIIGTNADETSRMVSPVSTDAEYQAAVRGLYGPLATRALMQYPSSRFPSPRAALIALTTDATWTCPSRRMASALAGSQTAPVHRYFFTWRAPSPAGAIIGATHGLEIPFIFRTFSALSANFQPTPSSTALSDAMQGYWSSFAAGGSPMGPVVWPRFPATGDVTLGLDDTITVLPGVRTADCDFLDSLAP